MIQRLDGRPGYGIVQRPFTVFGRAFGGGEHDIRRDATVLGTVTVDAEKLRHGESQAPQIVFAANKPRQIYQGLNRTFAEGRFADDDSASIVLNRAGKNLAGALGGDCLADFTGLRV